MDHYTDKLSEYLDGELGAAERQAIESHVFECAECAAALNELRRVTERAQQLSDQPPATDLWPGIAQRIRPAVVPLSTRRLAWRVSLSLPQLAAAAVLLVLVSGGAVWLWSRPRLETGVGGPAVVAVGSRVPAYLANADYDAAVRDLRDVLSKGRGRLDTTTVRILEQNLALIDRAIAQAGRAVADDPGNVYLNSHLAQTRMRKLELLRRAAVMANAAS
jgi:Putative zinc-finger